VSVGVHPFAHNFGTNTIIFALRPLSRLLLPLNPKTPPPVLMPASGPRLPGVSVSVAVDIWTQNAGGVIGTGSKLC
jgi:hypothetical protein